jgi:hypothetical protein
LDQQVLVAVVLGVAGLWLGHSYRRNVRQKTTERLVDAYAGLWDLTGAFGGPEGRAATDDAALQHVGAAMDAWYFRDGAGMLLTWRTRELFLAVRGNIVGGREQVRPASMAAELARRAAGEAGEADLQYRCLVRRQLSLLRSQLKSDLAMYRSDQRLRRLRPDERELLAQCRILRPWHAVLPWLPVSFSRTTGSICTCGHCGALR